KGRDAVTQTHAPSLVTSHASAGKNGRRDCRHLLLKSLDVLSARADGRLVQQPAQTHRVAAVRSDDGQLKIRQPLVPGTLSAQSALPGARCKRCQICFASPYRQIQVA